MRDMVSVTVCTLQRVVVSRDLKPLISCTDVEEVALECILTAC